MEKAMKNLEPEHEKILIEKFGEDSIRKFVRPDDLQEISKKIANVRKVTDNVAAKNENGIVISHKKGVPYYNVDFIGGFDMIINDQTINPEYYIQFKPYDKATCWCNITGHSMEPEISHGDIIALREIQDASFLPYGEIYAIVTTNEMRTVKRIGPSSNPDNYTLIPTNKSPEYGTQELPKNMILRIFEVMGCMKRL